MVQTSKEGDGRRSDERVDGVSRGWKTTGTAGSTGRSDQTEELLKTACT